MKSVLFKDWEVEAVLKGRKTQFRRVIKPQPECTELSLRWYWEKALDSRGNPFVDASRNWWEYYGTSPYGKAGDTLWVRESFWLCDSPLSVDWPVVIYEDEIVKYGYETSDWYKSRTDEFWLSRWWEGSKPGFGHHPSVHMPRGASRINIKIKSVRVERMCDISEEDAEAEGVVCFDPENDSSVAYIPGYFDKDAPYQDDCGSGWPCAKDCLRSFYKDIWDQWVWAVEVEEK